MNRLWELNFHLEKSKDRSTYIQIAETIIKAIKDKRLVPGEALPSSRKLAASIGVNRNTLVKALDILIVEGWLVAKDRSGVFVADIDVIEQQEEPSNQIVSTAFEKPLIVFDDGVPNTSIVPTQELARAYRRAFGLVSKFNKLGYSDSLGSTKFRQVISQMLNHERGMKTTYQNICITRGSQMALYLVAECILKPGDSILVEDPGYQPAWSAFKRAGADIIPISVDQEGINIAEIEPHLIKNKHIKAVYLTPHHQYPTTVTLSLKRRFQLIELSNRYNFKIIEDDYDHEFHFDKRPILPLSSHSDSKNCIYIGTFSKIVAPSLRIGYIHCEPGLINEVGNLRQIIDVQNDLIMEAALVELIKNGDIKRHVKRATRYYLDKKLFLEQLLKTYLKDEVNYHIPTGGLAFWIQPIKKFDAVAFVEYLASYGVQMADSSKYSFDNTFQGFRFGYANVRKDDMKKIVLLISDFLKLHELESK